MCGICGIFHSEPDQSVNRDALASMNQQIVHRGPDDDGFFVEKNVGLAMRRLSIIDVQTGHQPICNEDESVWIVFNGEIYNHRDLRNDLQARGHRYRTRSDTETIVHLYEEYGKDCVHHLRGMFSFAIWDRSRRCLFIARDRLGIKPLYYRYDGKTFLFGSEIKTIVAYPGVKPEFNSGTLAEYLAFGYIAGAESMYSGIQKLLPGHFLVVDDQGKLTTSSYWDLDVKSDDGLQPREHYVRRYREELERCVSSHLMSDVPLGVFLSGGLDSSAIAALTTRIRKEPIETFAVGYGEEAYSELPYARTISEHLKSKHHEVHLSRDEFFQSLPRLIWHEDEPIVWPSSVALYFVARLAKERVTVVLTGEGSDETLGGYTRYPWILMNSRLDTIYRRLTPASLRSILRTVVDASPISAASRRKLEHTFLMRDGASWPAFYFDNFYSAFSAAEQNELLTPDTKQTAGDAYAGSMKYWNQSSGDLLHRLLYTDIKTYLVELLMKQDQMSMATSIESRVPFLDHKLVEYAATLPDAWKLQGWTTKRVLREAMKGLLPESILNRPKMGFPVPFAGWTRGAWNSVARDILLDRRARQRGILEPRAVDHLLRAHADGRTEGGDRIWTLLNLELWHRTFIDGEGVQTLPHAHSVAEIGSAAAA
jgi:asparagine synthase (glutamine-hydrolysing)